MTAPTTATVPWPDRRSRLTREEFARAYQRSLQPVVVNDTLTDWPAFGKWTPRFFRERYGTRTVTIDDTAYPFDEFIDLVEHATDGHPAPYFRNVLISSWAPELMADIQPMPAYLKPNWLDSRFFPEPSLSSIELFIGSAGAVFPVLHYDNLHTHAFLMQVYGSKEYLLFPPDQGAFLYPRAGVERNKSSIPDIERTDLTRFPLFSRATPARAIVKAGEMLFVPSGWWHTTRILEPTITISVNTVNNTNWRPFVADYLANKARHSSKNRVRMLSFYLNVFGIIANLVAFC